MFTHGGLSVTKTAPFMFRLHRDLVPGMVPNLVPDVTEHFKRSFLDTAADCQRQGISFIPIVGEPSGGWGPSAVCVFKSLARTVANATGRVSDSA